MEQQPPSQNTAFTPWWGKINCPINHCQVWDFGTILIDLRRKDYEWQIRYQHSEINVADERNQVEHTATESDLDDSNLQRFVFSRSAQSLSMAPLLPDRNLVAKPISCIHLIPSEQITLYVSVALWLQFNNGDFTLFEIPIRELSDTWFGPSQRQGELCYSSRTHALVNKETLTIKPHRAIVPVTIVNQSDENLKIEKINLPVPFLTLYSDQCGQFWTTPVDFTRLKNGQEIKFSLAESKNYWQQRGNWTAIAPPRSVSDSGIVTRAMDMFFS